MGTYHGLLHETTKKINLMHVNFVLIPAFDVITNRVKLCTFFSDCLSKIQNWIYWFARFLF